MGTCQFKKRGFCDEDHRSFWFLRSDIKTGEFVSGREAPCGILGVKMDRGGKQGRQFCRRGNMIDMAVGEQIGHHSDVEFAQSHDELLGVIAGIDHNGLAGDGVGHEITIFF